MTIKVIDLLVLQPDQASLTEVDLPLLPKGCLKACVHQHSQQDFYGIMYLRDLLLVV